MDDYENFISGIENLWLNVDANKKIIVEYDSYFRKVFDLYKSTEAIRLHLQTLDSEKVLQMIGKSIHVLIVSEFRDFEIFDEGSRSLFDMAPKAELFINKIAKEHNSTGDEKELKKFIDSKFTNDVICCCLITSVCRFLRETKGVKGKTVGQFLFDSSATNYPSYLNSYQMKDEPLHKEESSFRKHSEKLFSNRKGHVYRQEWETISHDSETEMKIAWNLKQNRADLENIYKRMGNLYSHIHEIEKKPDANFSEEQIDNAFNKTISKINKVKYCKFLELGKYYLDEISKEENSKYYAINLYRFERMMKLYSITKIVSLLTRNIETSIEDIFLTKTFLLDDIPFTHIYSMLLCVERIGDLAKCVQLFEEYKDIFSISSLLIFNALVDTDFFGDSWLDLFCNFSRNLAPYVLYNPSDIDFSTHEGNQDAFEKLLKRPVLYWYASKKQKF